MSHRGHERDRRDDRRRDYGSSRPSERYDSSRRDGPNTRDAGGRSERRRSRSRSPRRHDGKDRDERRRSRSRSPQRHRSREREHDLKKRDDRRDDRKSDKRDDRRDRTRETNGHEVDESGKRQKPNLDRNDANNSMQVDSQNGEQGEEVNEEAMMAMMGFSGFTSTKGQEVEGNQQGGVKINKQRTWRQYMNRRGGFNRPLDRVK